MNEGPDTEVDDTAVRTGGEREALPDAHAERERRLYSTIISSTPDLVYVFSLDYRFLFANEALLRMWGRTLEDSIGKRLLDVGYEPWHAEMHEREIDQIIATREPVRGEVMFPHAELGPRLYDYIFVPVLGPDGAVEAIAGTTRDVTEMRQSEQHQAEAWAAEAEARQAAEEAVRVRDEFLSVASHELRNPVAAVRGAVQFLQRMRAADALSEERLGIYLEHLETSSRHLVRLTDDLLDLARLQHGRLPMRFETEDVASLVRRVASDARWEGHQVRLELPEAPVEAVVDSTRLTQVIENLLDNAVKFSAAGSVVTVRVASAADGVLMDIKDEGIGLGPGATDEIFDPFRRASNASAAQGLGLGLSIARQIVEEHGGRLRAESPGEGMGTTMHVWLPWRPVQEEGA